MPKFHLLPLQNNRCRSLSRVVEYIKGYDLDIEEAELPTGDHELLVAIQDIAGNPNERILKVTVVE